MDSSKELDDPYTWSVGQVVDALCNPEAIWSGAAAPSALPEKFKNLLTDNDINGAALLDDVGDVELANDLGLKSLGHRSLIKRAILQLRSESAIYQQKYQHLGPPSLATPSTAQSRGPWQDFMPNHERMHRGTTTPSPLLQEHLLRLESLQDLPLPEPTIESHYQPNHGSKRLAVKPPRPPVPTFVSGSESPPQHTLLPLTQTDAIDDTDEFDVRNAEFGIKQAIAKQSSDRADRTTADRTPIFGEDGFRSARRKEPSKGTRDGETFVMDAAGKKRRKLDLTAQSSSLRPATSRLSRVLTPHYLTDKGLPIDELFYGRSAVSNHTTEMQDEIDGHSASHFSTTPGRKDSESFVMIPRFKIADGSRLHVKRMIYNFLRQQPLSLGSDKDMIMTAVIPYPGRLTPLYKPRTFALFTEVEGRAAIDYQKLGGWPRVEDMLDEKRPRSSGKDTILPEQAAPKPHENWDYLLDKFTYNQPLENEKTYGPLGESGSEDGYETDIWDEMEQERNERETLQRQSTSAAKSRKPTFNDIQSTIDEEVKDQISLWKEKQFPLLERKGWRLWRASRREKSKALRAQILVSNIARFEGRLGKLKKEIAGQAWPNLPDVRKQCRILEATVQDLEESKWRLALLECATCPAKPPPMAKTRERVTSRPKSLSDDEEIIEGSDSSEYPEEMDGFLVPDDPPKQAPIADNNHLVDNFFHIDDVFQADLSDQEETTTKIGGRVIEDMAQEQADDSDEEPQLPRRRRNAC